LGGPDSETWLSRAGIARRVDSAECVNVLHRHFRGARGELSLRQSVDLRAVKAVSIPWVGIGRDVKAVRIRADVRIIAQTWAGVGRIRVVRAVIGDIDLVYIPVTCRIRCLADCDIQMIHERERSI
jgi:hypothetical protein